MQIILPRWLTRRSTPSPYAQPAQAVQDESEGVVLKNFYREQEEGGIPPQNTLRIESVPWRLGQQFPWAPSYLDDEIGEPLKNFYREQEEGKPPGFTRDPFTVSAPWLAIPFSDDEVGEKPLLNFYREQEDYPYQSIPSTWPIGPGGWPDPFFLWLDFTFSDDERQKITGATTPVDDESLVPFVTQASPFLAGQRFDADEYPPQQVPVFVQDSGADVATPGATLTITPDPGSGPTDCLILVIANGHAAASIGSWTGPAGWTKFSGNIASVNVNAIGAQVFWSRGDNTNLTFTKTGTIDNSGWQCNRYTGVFLPAPIDSVASVASANSGQATISVAGTTVVANQSMHVIAFADWNKGQFSATGFVNLENVNPVVDQSAAQLYNPTLKSPGATGSVTVTSSASATSQLLLGFSFALRPAQSPVIGDDETGSLSLIQRPLPASQPAGATLDDDLHPTSTVVTIVDDEQPGVTQTAYAAWISKPFIDDEAGEPLKNFYREQEEPWVGQRQFIGWLPKPFLDDETGEPLAYFGKEQEDAWIAYTVATPWLPRPYLDDEIGEPLKNFYVEQEEPWIAQVQVNPWLPVSSLDEQAYSLPPFGVDDDPPWVGQVISTPWTSRPFIDEGVWVQFVFVSNAPIVYFSLEFSYLLPQDEDFAYSASQGVDFTYLISQPVSYWTT